MNNETETELLTTNKLGLSNNSLITTYCNGQQNVACQDQTLNNSVESKENIELHNNLELDSALLCNVVDEFVHIDENSENNYPCTECLTSNPKSFKYKAGEKHCQNNRRVSFPKNDNELVTGYLEPANPWALVQPIACVSELTELYRESCKKHDTKPIESIIKHLETLDLSTSIRNPILDLREENLTAESCEALEEVFKRVQYKLIDLTGCGLDDVSATALFDMIEYYEAALEIDISENKNITNRGWQACINMIKRSHVLQILSTRCTPLSETNAIHLGKAMLSSSLHTLKLEHCGLSGRPIASLCNYLRSNILLKELSLAYNQLNKNDAFPLGVLLKSNFHLQLLDISNNYIEDLGVLHLTEALIEQAQYFNTLQAKNTSYVTSSSCQPDNHTTNENNITNLDTVILNIEKVSSDLNITSQKLPRNMQQQKQHFNELPLSETLLETQKNVNLQTSNKFMKYIDNNVDSVQKRFNTQENADIFCTNKSFTESNQPKKQLINSIFVNKSCLFKNNRRELRENCRESEMSPYSSLTDQLREPLRKSFKISDGINHNNSTYKIKLNQMENTKKLPLGDRLHKNMNQSVLNDVIGGNMIKDIANLCDLSETIVQIAYKNDDSGTHFLLENDTEIKNNKSQINSTNIVINKSSETLTIIPASNIFSKAKSKQNCSGDENNDLLLNENENLDFGAVFESSVVPQRSFSLESLNSETSPDSNDSKPSNKLNDLNFAKNGTLERQNTISTAAGQMSTPVGLQVLMLWNNQITKQSGKPISDFIRETNSLHILNIGCNVLGNDFVINICSSLKTNKSLTSLGLQSTNVTCIGICHLANILEFGGNSTLQRIDLRGNNLQTTELTVLNDCLKTNKSIIRIDLDDISRPSDGYGNNFTIDYSCIINNIRTKCIHNEISPELELKRLDSVQQVRDHFFNSRKISLTCQSMRSTQTIDNAHLNSSERQLLDPDRKSNSRLRSPLPSPIPSPASSPVPSPSRSRFQVSRVIESSIDNQITNFPSNNYLPTTTVPICNSRFRISIVESNIQQPITPPTTAISNSSIYIINSSKNNKQNSISNQSDVRTTIYNNKPQINPVLFSSTYYTNSDFKIKSSMTKSRSINSSSESIKSYGDWNISSRPLDNLGLITHNAIKSPIMSTEISSLNPILSTTNYSVDSNAESIKIQDNLSMGTCENKYVLRQYSTKSPIGEALQVFRSDESHWKKIVESEKSSKQSQEKRVRKCSWISNPINSISKGDVGYPATLDKLLSLFQNPSSFFTKSSNMEVHSKKDTFVYSDTNPQLKKDSSSGSLFSWINKKENSDDLETKKTLSDQSDWPLYTVRQIKLPLQSSFTPDNTISTVPIAVDCISIKFNQEMKENISPENSITSTSAVNIKFPATSIPQSIVSQGTIESSWPETAEKNNVDSRDNDIEKDINI